MKHKKICPCSFPIKKQIAFFQPHLSKIGRSRGFGKKRELFQQAPKCLTNFISSCAGAILREDIELPKNQLQKLKKFKNILIQLADKKSLKKKQDLFNKKGGAFPFIPVLASILGNIAIPYIADKIRGH